MKFLISGGLGFIGQTLIPKLLADPQNSVIVIDKLSEQVHGANPDVREVTNSPRLQFIRDDICNRNVVQAALPGVDVVYHLAAETGTGQSMYDIENYFRTNVQGTAVLLEAMVKNTASRPKAFVLASSRSVYGEGAYVAESQVGIADAGRHFPSGRVVADMEAGRFDFSIDGEKLVPVPTLENDELKPQSLYAASKLAQEHMCQIACSSVGIHYTALRFQNVYGPGQSLRNPYTGIISIFTNILRQGRSIDIFEDGEESRDFVFVDDVATALWAAPSRKPDTPFIINVGCGEKTSVMQLAELLQKKLGLSGKARVSGRFRPGDIRHCFADTTRMKNVLGLHHLTSLEAGLSKTVDWALTQPIEVDRSEKATAELANLLKPETKR